MLIALLIILYALKWKYEQLCRGADKSLARPTFRYILFDSENISFDASLVIYTNSTNIPPIMVINSRYIWKSKSYVDVTFFFPGRAKDLSAPLYGAYKSALVLSLTVFDIGLQASVTRRFRGTSCLKAEIRIYKGVSPSNRDWRTLNIKCCKHAKQCQTAGNEDLWMYWVLFLAYQLHL